ncbi:hypothetical protein ACQPYK_48835 (plasmid) [Streptosporangium sp. CA-135522]|uniref:hypothetical protein n=1 Tax=Streptosporangium sp. CA-135522 TaxID=3240072 RepID=UPI003D93922F
MNTTVLTAIRRFPLVGWPRPVCPSLPARVTEVTEIADATGRPGADVIAEAAHALNKAALLASDCGLANLARDLCWQHINLYREAGSRLTVREARYMLEPVLNLARLQIRADNGRQALHLLGAVHRAVTANTDLVVEGRTLPLANLTGTQHEHRKLREWVWLQYLADGIRALALAGRWDEAVTHAEADGGIGLHLMEGRQAAIIAHCLRGALPQARTVLEESTLTEPWEQQVAACLTVMCAEPDGASADRDIAAMVGHFLGREPVRGYAFFRARLGLTVVTFVSGADPDAAGRLLARVASEAIEAGDGYAARDVLGYRSPLTGLTDAPREALAKVVAASGLGMGTMPQELLADLLAAAKVSTEAAARSLAAMQTC